MINNPITVARDEQREKAEIHFFFYLKRVFSKSEIENKCKSSLIELDDSIKEKIKESSDFRKDGVNTIFILHLLSMRSFYKHVIKLSKSH